LLDAPLTSAGGFPFHGGYTFETGSGAGWKLDGAELIYSGSGFAMLG